ncbi:hypothetical protein K504DRAFT_449932 [Pleomassaria siparia CBS 279.74]|uniref:BTB domain-containing protein n=1 Tax=Pleomassaria siparia CBS 279.74 TaxID=1314801 RepID=A0A6G1KK37_9PLEO|nr:hypothetical protein K504DRAFT_449932 [Pleomassaria siparia CBS 279.74]
MYILSNGVHDGGQYTRYNVREKISRNLPTSGALLQQLVSRGDFADTYNGRRRRLRSMATGNIGDLPASTYAGQYVPASAELPDIVMDETRDDDLAQHSRLDAPPGSVPPCPVHAVRPALAHRLHSNRLHVRAKAKLQRDRLLSGAMITVYVGEAKRPFHIHKNLLCHHSDLLEAELQSDGEKKVDTLELPDSDPAGFELFVKWLYTGRLDDVSDMISPHQKYDYATNCHRLYLLCDRFDMPQLKNVAMDQYRKGLNEAELVPDAEEINDIYRKSPAGSPFRTLMTQIAARQIMDPESARDVGTYRACFEANPDFALDLVSAIKLGTGGMLFDDPTDVGNECDYHDHEAGPNCHIKGKGKKQALKAPAQNHDLKFGRSDPSKSFVPPHPPPHPPRLIQNPQPPPRQAHPQDGTSVGPLRRRLTSPAPSTVGTSTEHITANLPSPEEKRDKFRQATPERVTPPERRLTDPEPLEMSPPVQDVRPPNSVAESRRALDSSISEEGDRGGSSGQVLSEVLPRRNIWQWTRVGTGRLGIIGRVPQPQWNGTGILTCEGATSAVTGSLDGGQSNQSLDDFSVPSSTVTEPDNGENTSVGCSATERGFEGLGITNGIVDSMWSQTRPSSDDLVASMNGTPSPMWTGEVANRRSPPTTPSPLPPLLGANEQSGDRGSASEPLSPRLKELKGNSDSPTFSPLPSKLAELNGDRDLAYTSSPLPEDSDYIRSPRPPKLKDVHGNSENTTYSPFIPRTATLNGTSTEHSPNLRRIPKYKIALTANILSPAQTVST